MITIVRQASVVSESLSIDFLIQIGTATTKHTHNIARMNKPIDFFFFWFAQSLDQKLNGKISKEGKTWRLDKNQKMKNNHNNNNNNENNHNNNKMTRKRFDLTRFCYGWMVQASSRRI